MRLSSVVLKALLVLGALLSGGTPTPVKAQYNLGALFKITSCPKMGMLASYSFNEGSGSTTADRSGGGHTITLTSSTWAAGHNGNSVAFNGTTSRGQSPTSSTLGFTTSYTAMNWVYPTIDPNDGNEHVTVDVEYSGGHFPITIEAYSYSGCTGCTNCQFENPSTSWLTVAYNTKLPLNTWTHVACTYDGTTQKIYINGVLKNSAAQTGTIHSSTGNFVNVGYSVEDSGDWFYGRVDDVRIYNTALTAAQISGCMQTAVTP